MALSRSDDVKVAVSFMAREPIGNHFRVASATIDSCLLSNSVVATRRGLGYVDRFRALKHPAKLKPSLCDKGKVTYQVFIPILAPDFGILIER